MDNDWGNIIMEDCGYKLQVTCRAGGRDLRLLVTCPTTCWDFETVVTNNAGASHGLPTAYANCSGPNAYQGFYGTNAASGVTFQNVVDCPYPKPTFPPCFPLVANEWMTLSGSHPCGNVGNC